MPRLKVYTDSDLYGLQIWNFLNKLRRSQIGNPNIFGAAALNSKCRVEDLSCAKGLFQNAAFFCVASVRSAALTIH